MSNKYITKFTIIPCNSFKDDIREFKWVFTLIEAIKFSYKSLILPIVNLTFNSDMFMACILILYTTEIIIRNFSLKSDFYFYPSAVLAEWVITI